MGRAYEIVRETLEAALPPGVPPSFTEIVNAKLVGRREIEARLRMIDGLQATVRLSRWALGWSHQYIDMPGGALSFEGGRWARVDDPQLELFGRAA